VTLPVTPGAAPEPSRSRRARRAGLGRPPLEEAAVVVAGGRGTDGTSPWWRNSPTPSAEPWGHPVATDEGWIDHAAQIGQTGVTISPRLYVGTRHLRRDPPHRCLQGAETIVVVNSDPDARIFGMADFGVVGDLREVLPTAIAALRGT
jgi:electron transfer flavoprotein alpha subunit